MNVFGKDALIGDYRLSDHGLMLATFNYEDSYNLGLRHDTNEEFLGKEPVPVYLGSKFSAKLMPTITVIQNPLISGKIDFTINEVREFLGRLTGFQGYKKMYVYQNGFLENLYYNVHILDGDIEKAGDKIVGIKLEAECDSQFAWIKETTTFETTEEDEVIKLNVNSDDKYNYLYPKVIVTSENAIDGDYIITNLVENRQTIINGISAEEVITMDSKLKIITSTIGSRNFSEDFNLKFLQLVDGENEIQINHPSTITFEMILPRKVGFF